MSSIVAAVGSRASYVVIENGRVELFFSRWGGQSVVADMLAGPAAATATIRPAAAHTPPPADDLPAALLWSGPDPVDELLDDVFCAGAALIDHDRRVLLAYQWMSNYNEFVDAIADCARDGRDGRCGGPSTGSAISPPTWGRTGRQCAVTGTGSRTWTGSTARRDGRSSA
jgi:hypothetical protein